MADFEKIVQWLLYIEDDHKIPGKILNEGDGAGLTRLGLTQRWHQADVPMTYFSTLPFKDAVVAAKAAYHKLYWNILDGDQIDSDQVAAPLLSFAVNDSPRVAVKTLQSVLGVLEDGQMGPNTLAELNSKDPDVVVRLYKAEWIGFYQRDVQLNPSKQKFLQGWINRANFPYPAQIGDLYQ